MKSYIKQSLKKKEILRQSKVEKGRNMKAREHGVRLGPHMLPQKKLTNFLPYFLFIN